MRLMFWIGVLVAWMLASNRTTDTIAFFVSWVRDASPAVWPAVIMTDRDHVQINALRIVYPDSQILLCKWHVLHAMRSHFNTNEFPDLWAKVKAFVNASELAVFAKLWVEILNDPSVPQSFVQYMRSEWLPEAKMWSLVMRKNRSIFEEGDINMLLEAYVFHFSAAIR
jgi:MULE transposase domain